jgi:hypothetical protein
LRYHFGPGLLKFAPFRDIMITLMCFGDFVVF